MTGHHRGPKQKLWAGYRAPSLQCTSHVVMRFHRREWYRTSMYSTFGHHLPLCQILFLLRPHGSASPWRKTVSLLTHLIWFPGNWSFRFEICINDHTSVIPLGSELQSATSSYPVRQPWIQNHRSLSHIIQQICQCISHHTLTLKQLAQRYKINPCVCVGREHEYCTLPFLTTLIPVQIKEYENDRQGQKSRTNVIKI